MSIYADTSFLVSLYTLDANSARAAARMQTAELPLLLTPLGELELENAFRLRLFRRELVPSKIKAAAGLLRQDFENGVLELRPLPATVFDRAKQIARRRTSRMGTRTLDILHVASALLMNAERFLTFDTQQERLARSEGLLV